MTAKRNAISSDEIVAPVATKKPLSAELPKDIQKLVDKKYNTK
jgi:F0F1-type ATP synthase delta subunit